MKSAAVKARWKTVWSMPARRRAKGYGKRSVVQWRNGPIRLQKVPERTPDGSDYDGADNRIHSGEINGGGGAVMDWHGWDQVNSACGLQ